MASIDSGEDGEVLTIVDLAGAQHTVIGPLGSGGLTENKSTATFSGTAGSYIRFVAYNGIWIAVQTSGVTLS